MPATRFFLSGYSLLPVGEIAVALPGAGEVFRGHRIDYFCNGSVSLATAAEDYGADLATIERELSVLPPRSDDAFDRPEKLIESIFSINNLEIRLRLADLTLLANQVETANTGHIGAPHGLSELLTALQIALEDHFTKEEIALFPLILNRDAELEMVSSAVAVARGEHENYGVALVAIEMMTNQFRPPVEADPSWMKLYAGLRVVCEALIDHIHLENNILFRTYLKFA